MFYCPTCKVELRKRRSFPGVFWQCPTCDGRTASIASLRQWVPAKVVNELWLAVRAGTFPHKRRCPACEKFMAEVEAVGKDRLIRLDVCSTCQFVWFDPKEYEGLPEMVRLPSANERLPLEARERLALVEIEAIREKARGGEWGEDQPEEWWELIPAVLGMPVEREVDQPSTWTWITWLLALLITAISVLAFFDLSNMIQKFGLIPADFFRYGGLTLLTSFFLHGGILHLFSNIYFLWIFGDNVEDWLGKWRYVLLVVLSILAGNIFHILWDPRSTVPCIGASGGIAGIISFYALKFPHARLGISMRTYSWFRFIRVPAYALFVIWLALQLFGAWNQVAGFGQVSALSHLGGALVGFFFGLLMRKN